METTRARRNKRGIMNYKSHALKISVVRQLCEKMKVKKNMTIPVFNYLKRDITE